MIPPEAHTTAPLLNYMREHNVPIEIPRRMSKEELEKVLNYGARSSTKKEKNFLRKDLLEQICAGHVAIFPWEAVKHLTVLWLSPFAAIPQVGRKPHLIYNFSWSGLNEKATQDSPKEAMRF